MHAPTLPAAGPKATAREWWGLAAIALPCMVYAMDLTVLNLAMPAISAELKPSAAQLLWIIDIYGFFVAGFLITMGNLGDRIGRRKLLLWGAAAFALASALAAFARSAESLIVLRALLGLAGATVAPSTLSLIRNMFHDEHQRQFAIGVWIASYSLGATIGPLVGGVLLQFFHWGSVFLLAVPVMALLLIVGPLLLPEYRDPEAGRIDPPSALLSLASVLAVIYGLKRIAESGFAPLPFMVAAVGCGLAWLFVRRQRGLAYPLLDLALFRNPTFAAAIAAYGCSSLAMFGVYIFVAQYLQGVLGLSPLHAGIATAPGALGWVLGSLITPRLARRFSQFALLVGGLVLTAGCLALLAFADGGSGWRALPLVLTANVLLSLAMAPVVALGNQMIITAAPPERAGAASAISETSAEFSGALGIALFGSLGAWVYRQSLADLLPPRLPDELAQNALATLGGALAAAAALPAPVGAALSDAARVSFVDALQAVCWVAAIAIIAIAALTARLLRRPSGR